MYQRAPSTSGGGGGRFLKGRSKGTTTVVENLVSPLYGIEVGFDDAQELGRQVKGLPALCLFCNCPHVRLRGRWMYCGGRDKSNCSTLRTCL